MMLKVKINANRGKGTGARQSRNTIAVTGWVVCEKRRGLKTVGRRTYRLVSDTDMDLLLRSQGWSKREGMGHTEQVKAWLSDMAVQEG